MNEIYALFNPAQEIVKVGLKLRDVTNHLECGFSANVWNALFKAESKEKQKAILESVGYKVEVGELKIT